MRALLQRVTFAKVEINSEIKGQIEKGLLVFVAFKEPDTEKELEWMARKMVQLRIFSDAQGLMNLSLNDVKGALLIVSQFTLYADSRKGNRPSFVESAAPAQAIPLYEIFLQKLKQNFSGKIETGEFGADMKVSLLNDGPVTILLEKEAE